MASDNKSRRRKRTKSCSITKRPTNAWDTIWLCPVLLEEIFKSMDFERLKTYRLVCKEWNQEICRSSQYTTRLTCRGDFQKLLQLLNVGERLNLPTPLKSLHCSFLPFTFTSPDLRHVQRLQARIGITKLTLSLKIRNIPTNVHAMNLLRLCSNSLTYLKIEFYRQGGEGQCPRVDCPFPRLQRLVLWQDRYIMMPSRDRPEEELIFFGGLISSSPSLKQLKMNKIGCVSELLKSSNLKGIEELGLLCDPFTEISPSDWSGLNALKITNLKKLRLRFFERDAEHFYPLISRFSSSLEHLQIGVWGVKELPPCPKLRHLELYTFYTGVLDPALFPALRSITLGEIFSTRSELNLSPFLTVLDAVYGEVGIFSLSDYTAEQSQLIFLEWFQLFPNATRWTVPYNFLPEFIKTSNQAVRVERLRIVLKAFDAKYCTVRRTKPSMAADIETFSTLHLLSDLEELELYNEDGMEANRNMDIEAIDLKSLPKLKTLRHFGDGLRRYHPVKKHLEPVDQFQIILNPNSDPFKATQSLTFMTRRPNWEFVLRRMILWELRDKLGN